MKQFYFSTKVYWLPLALALIQHEFSTPILGAETVRVKAEDKEWIDEGSSLEGDQIPPGRSIASRFSEQEEIMSFDPQTNTVTYDFRNVSGFPYPGVYKVPLRAGARVDRVDFYNNNETTANGRGTEMNKLWYNFWDFLNCYFFTSDCICVHGACGAKFTPFPQGLVRTPCFYDCEEVEKCAGTRCDAYASCKKYLDPLQYDLDHMSLIFNNDALCQLLLILIGPECSEDFQDLGLCDFDAIFGHFGTSGECKPSSSDPSTKLPRCPIAEGKGIIYCRIEYDAPPKCSS